MKKINYFYKNNSGLCGITDKYELIDFKPGDKFKYQGNVYRVGHQGNYFPYIPWWRYSVIISAIVDMICGTKDYDY